MTWETLRDLCDLYNCDVTLMHLPGTRGVVVKRRDDYLILINHDLDDHQKRRTLWHELLHVILGHHDSRNYLTESDKENEVKDIMK